MPDQTHTLIESYANGWAWSVPGSSGTRYVAVMVDPRTSDLSHDRRAREVYLGEIGKTTHLAAIARTAVLTRQPTGWDASMYRSTTYAADDVLLVGDAGSFIDPLSSIGVKKALASGWLAAIVTHTAIIRPAMRQTALEFFAAREAEIYSAFRSMTTLYLAEAAAAHAHAFWTDRTEHEVHGGNQDAAAVKAAFDRIRAARSFQVQRAPGLRVDERPAIAGCEVVTEARVVSASQPAGVRYLFDVDVVALIDMAPEHSQVPDLFEAYNRRHPPVSLPDFLSALSTVVANGWLVQDA